MQTFDVIFTYFCSCFVDGLSEALTDPKRCSTNLIFDYVRANRDQKVVNRHIVETFDASCSILFNCYKHIMEVFIFHPRVSLHYSRCTFSLDYSSDQDKDINPF